MTPQEGVAIATALARRFGAGGAQPNLGFGGGTAWPCPACHDGRGGRRPLTLLESGVVECFNNCPPSQILDALRLHAGDPAGSTGSAGTGSASIGTSSDPLSAEVPVVPVLTGDGLTRGNAPEDLNRLACDERVVGRAMQTLGIHAGLGESFPCVLPGHDAPGGRASVVAASDLFMYRDCAEAGEGQWRLAEVRAALAYGEVRKLSASEAAVWYRRLFYEAQCLRPLSIALPALPADAAPVLRGVRSGFELLIGLRWLSHHLQPTMFGRFFVAAWCGIEPAAAYSAILTLTRLGVIRRVGQHKRTYLYLPGDATGEEQR